MKMTNERAKEILDFIVSKNARYSMFGVEQHFGYDNRIIVIDYNNESFNLYAVNKKKVKAIRYAKDLENISMRYILNEILKHTEQGYNIETCFEHDMILPAYATLEQIEIEMDLENDD